MSHFFHLLALIKFSVSVQVLVRLRYNASTGWGWLGPDRTFGCVGSASLQRRLPNQQDATDGAIVWFKARLQELGLCCVAGPSDMLLIFQLVFIFVFISAVSFANPQLAVKRGELRVF